MNSIELSESEMSQIQIALSTRIEYLNTLIETLSTSAGFGFLERIGQQSRTCRHLLGRIRGDE